MPTQFWLYECGCRPSMQVARRCYSCGASGRYLGWKMTSVERAEAYFHATGILLPSQAEDPFVSRLVTCPVCEGEGLFQSLEEEDLWAACPLCNGTTMAVDGQFDLNWFLTEHGMGEVQRWCDTRYREAHWRRRRGGLDRSELEGLRTRLASAIPPEATLVPAVRDGNGERIAVGPTHVAIIEWIWRPRFTWDLRSPLISGFIDLDSGRFLTPRSALHHLITRNLMPPQDKMGLREWRLGYHRAIPFLMVRGRPA